MQEGALSDLKVVELANFITGPLCGKLLAAMGAEVVKVEDPKFGDEARRREPFLHDLPHPERSGLFLYFNMNKLSITLNVRNTLGAKIFKELIKDADVLIENNPPSLMQSLGFDYESLSKINPRLIMTSITPFGQTGPYRDYKGSDLICWQMGGLGYLTPGGAEDPETMPPLKGAGRQADCIAGYSAATATMCAVYGRRATGLGQHVDVSVVECVASSQVGNVPTFLYDGNSPLRTWEYASVGGGGLMPAKGGYFTLATMEERQWQDFMEIMGNPDWGKGDLCKDRASRNANWPVIMPKVVEWTMNHTPEEISNLCQAKRVPCLPVNSSKDLLESEQLAARGFFIEVEHPEAGKLKYIGPLFQLAETPWQTRSPAPLLGQHNVEIICGQLGYSREDLVRMREAGII